MLGVFPCPILPGSGPPEPPLLSSLSVNFEVQQGLGFRVVFITLLWGEEAESLTRSVVERLGDARAVALGDASHALTLR